jgi:hypothetical protein
VALLALSKPPRWAEFLVEAFISKEKFVAIEEAYV